MPKTPTEPTNLVLEQLRLMRAETNARLDKLAADISRLEGQIKGLKTEMHGFKLGTIAEVYKANLTVGHVAMRLDALERKVFG